MDSKQLERCARRVYSQAPLIGRWLRQNAVQALSRDGSTEAIRILAEATAKNPDESTRTLAIAELRKINDPRAVDNVCSVWALFRYPVLAGLIVERDWVAAAPGRVRVLTALKIKNLDLIREGAAEVVDPLLEACGDADEEIALEACRCLSKLKNPDAIDALCARWVETRSSELDEAIGQGGYIARRPPLVHVLSALKLGQLDVVTGGYPDLIEPLIQACTDSDSMIAQQGRTALGRMRRQEAQEALCRCVLGGDAPLAREIAVAAQFAPRDPLERALFYFLTEQWAKYESLDFDRSLLNAAYENGNRRLRGRIAERARQAGRTEWVGAIAERRRDRHLREMEEEEWEAALAVLSDNKRWTEMWRLAQLAPADWSVRFLTELGKAAWRPENEHELNGFATLLELASRCQGEPAFLGRLMRFAVPLNGHTAAVSCLAISLDGQGVASGSNDYTVRLWRLSGEQGPRTLEGHTDWVTCIAMSPDGQMLASGSRDDSARLWSFPEGTLIKRLDGHANDLRCLAFTPDGRTLATGSDDATVRLWGMPEGKALKVLSGHTDIISCLAVSPDGLVLASGSYDNQVRLWSLPDGALLATLSGHKAMVNCLVFSPDSLTLASGSKDRMILLWSLPSAAKPRRLKGHRDDISCLAISPDGRLLASGSWDTTVGLWSFPDGESLGSLGATGTVEGHEGWVNCLAFSPDGCVLASGGSDNTVRLWSIPGGAPLKTLEHHRDRVVAVLFSRDGRTLASGSWDRTIGLWKSELARLRRIPFGQATQDDLSWVEEALFNSKLSEAERAWLEFLRGMMQWRRRFDIQVEECPRISVGEFDIEIED